MAEPIKWCDDLTPPQVNNLSDRLVGLLWALAELHVAHLRVPDWSYQAEKLKSAMSYVRGQVEGYFRDPGKIPGNSEEGEG